jgi:hypothetical protein
MLYVGSSETLLRSWKANASLYARRMSWIGGNKLSMI